MELSLVFIPRDFDCLLPCCSIGILTYDYLFGGSCPCLQFHLWRLYFISPVSHMVHNKIDFFDRCQFATNNLCQVCVDVEDGETPCTRPTARHPDLPAWYSSMVGNIRRISLMSLMGSLKRMRLCVRSWSAETSL